MAHDVFISYSNKDKPVADAVVAGLENKGIRCWVAPRDVTPGTSWGQAIVNAIQASKIMVIILSENSNQSRQVVREVERAVVNEVIIIPFRIENITPTGAMAYFLSTEHWLDALSPPLENHIEKLRSTIQLFLSGDENLIIKERTNIPVTHPSTQFPRRSPFPLLAILLSFIILVVLGVFFIPKLIGKSPTVEPVTPAESDLLINTSPPDTPTPVPPPSFSLIGEYRTSGSANGLYVTNSNMLYLASGTEGLIKISVADPTDPKPISIFQAAGAQDVVVDENIAYIVSGDYSRQLTITRLGGDGVSTTFPNESGYLDPTQSIYNVAVSNGLVHITGHNYWGIHDISDPLNPKNLWSWDPPSQSGNPCVAFVESNIAYIGCGWAGFFIFDITDPIKPELLSSFDTKNWVIDIDVVDQTAYLTLGESGLITLDVHDPSKPIMLDQINLEGFSSDISVSGNHAYVIFLVYENNNVIDKSGVFAVNISDPEKLQLEATYEELYSGSDIQVVDDVVFITDEPRGLVVLSLDN